MAVDLQGAVACITGGARGIGRATASALAKRGARVWIGDIDLELAQHTASELGVSVRSAYLDVSDDASYAAFLAAAEADGPVTVLVNNAGIMRTGSFCSQNKQGQERELAINLGGVVTGMRLALPGMLERNRGHIVNVSSMAGKLSLPGAALYSATKFAVVALSRAVRAEIVNSAVTITTVLPSLVRTDLTAGLDTRGLPAVDAADVAEAIAQSCRHGRAEVTVPRWVAPVGILEEALPERLAALAKRALGAEKRITVDNAQRRHYQTRA